MDPAIVELKEKLLQSEEFKERTKMHLIRMANLAHCDMEAVLNREIDYYVKEGFFLREMAHTNTLASCQYDNGRCIICGGFQLENDHPNFR